MKHQDTLSQVFRIGIGGVLLGVIWAAPFASFRAPLSAPLGWFFALSFSIVAMLLPLRTSIPLTIVASLAGHFLAFHWLPSVFQEFFSRSSIWGIGLLVLLALWNVIPLLLVLFMYQWTSPKLAFVRASVIGVVWVILDLHFPRPFPWMLGHSQLEFPFMASLAAWGGVPFISFVMLVVSGLAIEIARTRNRQSLPSAFLLLLIIGAAYIWHRESRASVLTAIKDAPRQKVFLVQTNFPSRHEYVESEDEARIERLLALSASAPPRSLVVWPESSVLRPVYLDMPESFPGPLQKFVAARDVALLYGGRTLRTNAAGEIFGHSNSLILLEGGHSSAYHKLVPFPFAEDNAPTDGNSPLVFVRGNVPGLFEFPPTKIGVLICFEILEDRLSRLLLRQGAEILFELSNTNWFKMAAALEQQSAFGSWQAIENQRFLVRSVNAGVSETIDPFGRRTILGVNDFGSGEEEIPRLRLSPPALTFVPLFKSAMAAVGITLAIILCASWRGGAGATLVSPERSVRSASQR